MKIIFLRHGESMGNVWNGAYNDDTTNFLSLRGTKQAELAGYTIDEWGHDIDRVYCSNMTRAIQTATTVMQSSKQRWQRRYLCDSRINEWCHDAPMGHNWHLHEDEQGFHDRVRSFFDDEIIPNWDSDMTLLVVSHCYTMLSLFDCIKIYNRQCHSYTPLDPEWHPTIPNAIPYMFDTDINEIPVLTYDHSVNR